MEQLQTWKSIADFLLITIMMELNHSETASFWVHTTVAKLTKIPSAELREASPGDVMNPDMAVFGYWFMAERDIGIKDALIQNHLEVSASSPA